LSTFVWLGGQFLRRCTAGRSEPGLEQCLDAFAFFFFIDIMAPVWRLRDSQTWTSGQGLGAANEDVWQKVFDDLLNQTWYGSKSETYKLLTCDYESWTCLREDGDTQKRYTIWYDASAYYLWWGEKSTYFADLGDLMKESRKLRWFRANDVWKKGKPAFVWESWAEDLEESTDDAGDNASTKESVHCDSVDDSGDNASTREFVEEWGDSASFQSLGHSGEACTATLGDAAAAEELIKIIGPPPGLECLAQVSCGNDNDSHKYVSEESTTDASISGDETLPPARPPGKLGPPGDLRTLLNFTPLPHEQVMEDVAPLKIMLGPEDSLPMMGAFGSAAAEASAGMSYSSGQRFENLRAHHRPRVKKESSGGDHPFAPLTRSTRVKASVPSNETGSRTQLRSSAKMFQPLPFMSMTSVQQAWNKWEQSSGMPRPGPWQQQYYGSHNWAASSQ